MWGGTCHLPWAKRPHKCWSCTGPPPWAGVASRWLQGSLPKGLCKHCPVPHYLCTASWSGSPSELSSSTGVTAGTACGDTGGKSSRRRFFRNTARSRNRAADRPFWAFSYLRNFCRVPGLYGTSTCLSSFSCLPRSGDFNLHFFLWLIFAHSFNKRRMPTMFQDEMGITKHSSCPPFTV